MKTSLIVGAIAAVAVLGVPSSAAATDGGVTSRVSKTSAERQANASSTGSPAISERGRYVAFASQATNLASGDTNGAEDVFIRDRVNGVTRRVSIGARGQANAPSFFPAISAHGRYVAFASGASNLVPADTNGTVDVFVRDRLSGITHRVSVGAAGQGNGTSTSPAISAHGRYIAFVSDSSNLVAGDTNGVEDVFVRDLLAGTTRRVSVGAARQGNGISFYPAISAHGRYVAFGSYASNLVVGDTNGVEDVFVRDLLTGATRRISVGAAGQANASGVGAPAISAHGRYVAFASEASNLVSGDVNGAVDVFVRDRVKGVTRRVSIGAGGQANDVSSSPAISAHGRYVAFGSEASNLVRGDTNAAEDVFVRDRLAGITRRASIGAGGQGDADSAFPAISADGHYVAFASNAANLVPSDTNGVQDMFIRKTLLDAT